MVGKWALPTPPKEQHYVGMTLQGFRPVGEVVTDDRRRIPVSKAGAQAAEHYSMAVHSDGRILLTPMALIPKRELVVWENEELQASLARGIAQVRNGELGDELDLDELDVDDEAE